MTGWRFVAFLAVLGCLLLGAVGYAALVVWLFGDSDLVGMLSAIPVMVFLVLFVNEMVRRRWPF